MYHKTCAFGQSHTILWHFPTLLGVYIANKATPEILFVKTRNTRFSAEHYLNLHTSNQKTASNDQWNVRVFFHQNSPINCFQQFTPKDSQPVTRCVHVSTHEWNEEIAGSPTHKGTNYWFYVFSSSTGKAKVHLNFKLTYWSIQRVHLAG